MILCSGKIYYDLYEDRIRRGLNDVYLLRLEQLYPFPHKALVSVSLARFPSAQVIWCQEEPQNMGAWTFVQPNIEWVLNYLNAKVKRPVYAGRTIVGLDGDRAHEPPQKELKELLEDAFARRQDRGANDDGNRDQSSGTWANRSARRRSGGGLKSPESR